MLLFIINIFHIFQGRHRSSRWTTSGIEEAAKCVPIVGLIEARFSRAENAVLLQAWKCKCECLSFIIIENLYTFADDIKI